MRHVRRILAPNNNSGLSLKTLCRTYSTLPKQATVARYKQHGNVLNAIKLETVPLPSELQPNQVLVKMLAAPINPADINMIEGNYGKLTNSFPAIGGNEGVGVVEQVGSGVTDLKVNQRVIPAKAGFGTWRDYAVAKSEDLIAVPNDIPEEYSAILSVNPSTAYRLLHDFADLKAGDVVVQNGANSAVGLSVIQLCKKRGIKTINIIRAPRPNQDTLIENLKILGGTIVVTEQYANSPAMKTLVSDLPKAKLGLNSVGGDSARTVAKFLGDDAQLVTFGGMSRKPISLPTGPFIFNNISARGFWLTQWVEKAPRQEKEKMLQELHTLVKNKELVLFMENRKFSDFPHALETAMEPYRDRKVIIKF